MQPSASPTFGKRRPVSRAQEGIRRQAEITRPDAARSGGATPDPAAFFAALRREAEEQDMRPRAVPRSFRAAMLAGLVVGCCLAGLDITGAAPLDPHLIPLLELGGFGDGSQLLPALIALSLLSGARTAATTLLIAHRLLARAGWTGYGVYIAACAAVALACALLLAALGHPPRHGWIIDLVAGAGAGFFYRLFAGATASDAPGRQGRAPGSLHDDAAT